MSAAVVRSGLDVGRSHAWGGSRRYLLGLLAIVGLLNTADQSILAVTSPRVQLELGLTDGQVGLLSGAFVVVYALAALPSGWAVDRLSRRVILGVGVGPGVCAPC